MYLTVQIVTGRAWYRHMKGSLFNVAKDNGHYRLLDSTVLTVDKNHAVVRAVHYEDEGEGDGESMIGAE